MKSLKILATIAVVFFSTTGFSLTFDNDVSQNLKNQMLADLDFMAQLQGDGATPLHQEIFGPSVDGQTYKNFFETRITKVGLNDCGDAKAVACVIPFFNPHKMWITNNFIKFSHPQIARMMVVYHESRHSESENGNWAHDDCPTPFVDENGNEIVSIWTGATLAGEAACDSTPYGSYGSSTILLHNISQYCTNCSDKVKMDAKLYSDDQTNRMTGKAKVAIKKDFGS
jgi:hypothetical protein